ncbi:uncharacterized protein BX663DRAFT_494005, partial [Cokeromyces recurvatus]|uniref:uncharacterized protein n=1 Tax=Cokeromyces recurvatus TaxID=90255 RepID=UPI00222026B2
MYTVFSKHAISESYNRQFILVVFERLGLPKLLGVLCLLGNFFVFFFHFFFSPLLSFLPLLPLLPLLLCVLSFGLIVFFFPPL